MHEEGSHCHACLREMAVYFLFSCPLCRTNCSDLSSCTPETLYPCLASVACLGILCTPLFLEGTIWYLHAHSSSSYCKEWDRGGGSGSCACVEMGTALFFSLPCLKLGCAWIGYRCFFLLSSAGVSCEWHLSGLQFVLSLFSFRVTAQRKP